MPKLTSQQRAHIRRRSKYHEPDPSELSSELNIVPFLDIVVNLIMFLLATSEAVLAIIQIEAQLPQLSAGAGRAGDKKEPGLNLNVTLTESGIIVTGSGGKLAPGCQDVASGRVITVAKKDGKYDWPGLTECVGSRMFGSCATLAGQRPRRSSSWRDVSCHDSGFSRSS